MDMPPNNPNDNNNQDRARGKLDPNDGGRQANRGGGGSLNEQGEMDMVGDLRDQGMVVMLFLMGVANWLLRERCTC